MVMDLKVSNKEWLAALGERLCRDLFLNRHNIVLLLVISLSSSSVRISRVSRIFQIPRVVNFLNHIMKKIIYKNCDHIYKLMLFILLFWKVVIPVVFRTCRNSMAEADCPEEVISNCSIDDTSHTSNIPTIRLVSSTEHLSTEMNASNKSSRWDKLSIKKFVYSIFLHSFILIILKC